jgi:hypothetical protein
LGVDQNPFNKGQTKTMKAVENHRLNIFSKASDMKPEKEEPIETLSTLEKTSFMIKLARIKTTSYIIDKVRKVTDPIMSKTQDTTAFLLAEKSSIFGENSSEVYQLLKLLSSKKHYIALKASAALETKLLNSENRKIIRNYFNFNPEARAKYAKLYAALLKADNAHE